MATATATKPAQSIDWNVVQTTILGKRDERSLPPWVKLPTLPKALMECMQKAEEPDVGPGELGLIVEKDAGLTCQLLRHANSAALGFREKVRTAQEAMARLGTRKGVMFLMTEGVKQVLKSCESKVVNFQNFWCANLERALFAKHLARHFGADEEVAFTGGMLADCLLPVMSNQESGQYLEFVKRQRSRAARLVDFEKERLGWDHALASGIVLSGWGFPPDLVCCVLLHHRGTQLLKGKTLGGTAAAAVAVSGLLPDQLGQEPTGVKQLKKLRVRGFDVLHTAEVVREEFRQLSPQFDNPYPLLRKLRGR